MKSGNTFNIIQMLPLPSTPAALGCLDYFEVASLFPSVFIMFPVKGLADK